MTASDWKRVFQGPTVEGGDSWTAGGPALGSKESQERPLSLGSEHDRSVHIREMVRAFSTLADKVKAEGQARAAMEAALRSPDTERGEGGGGETEGDENGIAEEVQAMTKVKEKIESVLGKGLKHWAAGTESDTADAKERFHNVEKEYVDSFGAAKDIADTKDYHRIQKFADDRHTRLASLQKRLETRETRKKSSVDLRKNGSAKKIEAVEAAEAALATAEEDVRALVAKEAEDEEGNGGTDSGGEEGGSDSSEWEKREDEEGTLSWHNSNTGVTSSKDPRALAADEAAADAKAARAKSAAVVKLKSAVDASKRAKEEALAQETEAETL